MRRFNLRLLGVLLVMAIVVALGVNWWHGVQIRRNAFAYLREAERAKEERRFSEALANFDRYLQFEPDDAAALAEFALLSADLPDHARAYDLLEKALRLDGQRSDVRRRLVEVAVELERFTDAQEHLDQHLLDSAPQDPELLALRGRSQEGLGQYEAAARSFRSTIEYGPERLEVYLRLASLLRQRLNRAAEADGWMEQMVAANASLPRAYMVHASYLRSTRPVADTPEAFRKGMDARLRAAAARAARAAELSPEDKNALLLAAECALARRQYDEARKYADRILAIDRRFVPVYVAMADIESRRGRRQEAVGWLKRGLDAMPNQTDLLWQLAVLYLENGDTARATELAAKLRDEGCSEAMVGYLHGRAECTEKQWLRASRTLERVRPDLLTRPDLVKELDYWLGNCYGSMGSPDQQLIACRRAANADPFWLPARNGLVSALLRLDRLEEAQEEVRQVIQMGGPTAAWIEFARLEIWMNLRRPSAQRHWAEARRALDGAEKAEPTAVGVPLLRAEVLVAEGRYADAEKLLENARAKSPGEVEVWIAQAALAGRQRDWKRAASRLDEAAAQRGDSVALRLARADLMVQQYGKDAVDRLQSLGEKTEQLPADGLPRLWSGLAIAHLQTASWARQAHDALRLRRSVEQARIFCQRWSSADPANIQVWLMSFDLALAIEDTSGLEPALGEIERLAGRGPFWHYGSALLLSIQAKAPGHSSQSPALLEKAPGHALRSPALLEKALEHMAEVRGRRPDWGQAWRLTGEIHERQGDVSRAIEDYLRAVDLGERSAVLIERVVRLLYQQDRHVDADRVVRRVAEQVSPFSAEFGRLASELSLRLEDFDRALALARQSAADSKEFGDHVWLGLVLGILGQRAQAAGQSAEAVRTGDEAEREFRRAIELAPDEAEPWVALIQFFVRSGRKEKAEETLAQAEKKISADRAPLALAQCLESLGEFKRSERKYAEALAANPKDARVARRAAEFHVHAGQFDAAEALLRKITGGQVPAGPADSAWSRRTLASLQVRSGDPSRRSEGLKMIDQNLAGPYASLDDWRVKAALLGAARRSEQRAEAIQIMEKEVLGKQREPRIEDRFALGTLYLSQGDWSRARRHLRSALAATPAQPEYLETYIAACLAHDETHEAEAWLDRLEQASPDGLVAVEFRAQILLRRGEFDQILALLRRFVDSAEPSRKDRADRTNQAAAVISGLGKQLRRSEHLQAARKFAEEAEAILRKSAQGHPEHALVLAGFLARQGRFEEALTLAEQGWAASSPQTIAAVISVVPQDVPPPLVARAERILTAALERYERPVCLLMTLADLRSFQERYGEAEALYREVLKKNAGHVPALNNLAVLLASQGKDLESAQRSIDAALAAGRPTANLLDSRALVYLARGRLPDALRDVEEALKETPAALGHLHRAQILHELGQVEGAREALRQAEKAGLRADAIHPLDRAMYKKLNAALRPVDRGPL